MKHMRVVGLLVVMLAAARIARAQVLNEDVGVPISSVGNPGGPVIEINDQAQEDLVTPIVSVDGYLKSTGILDPFTMTSPGDLILTSGGDAPSDWLADIRFFNPLDPTGTLGLPATETEAFFPDDLTGGFASFQLLPEFNLVPGLPLLLNGAPGAGGSEEIFGPLGGVNQGQLAIIIFQALPGAQAASTPEPGGMALLFGVGIVGVGLLVRRRRWFSHA